MAETSLKREFVLGHDLNVAPLFSALSQVLDCGLGTVHAITPDMNTNFEIVIGSDKWTTRETLDSVRTMLSIRGLNAVKRGYTTWALYEGGKRVGSMCEL
jgi:hypothetical protein